MTFFGILKSTVPVVNTRINSTSKMIPTTQPIGKYLVNPALSFEKSMKNVSTWVQASDQAYLSQRSRVLGV